MEKIPTSWNESTIIQLPKGKSKLGDLDGIRHIHDKKEAYKFFGHIVTAVAKEPIFKNMPKFQIACRPGHRPSEHLFVVRSVISYYKEKNKGLLITSFDLKKFFDIENLPDCMNSLYKLNVKGKIYRFLYEMNKNARIKVKTPVGTSDSEDTGPVLSQGSVEAAIVSSSNVAVGVEEQFGENEKEVK